jgi:hypothetical protein
MAGSNASTELNIVVIWGGVEARTAKEFEVAAADKFSRFEQAILPHLDAAYNLARWLTRDENEAADAVQDACLGALRFIGGFQWWWRPLMVARDCAQHLLFPSETKREPRKTRPNSRMKSTALGLRRRCVPP